MPIDLYKNFAAGTVAVAPSPATTGTSLTMTAGQGAWLPTPPFNAAVWPASGAATPSNAEIVRVTAKATDVLTIARSQEGSTARSIAVGDQLVAAVTAKTITDLNSAANLTGMLPDSALSANIPRLNANPNVFTGQHLDVQSATPYFALNDTAQPSGSRAFIMQNSSQIFSISALNDDYSSFVLYGILTATRAGDVKVIRDLYEKQRTTPLGHWVQIPYDVANFTSDAGAWSVPSGNVLTYDYMLLGKTMWLAFLLTGGSITGSPAGLRLQLPSGYTINRYTETPIEFSENSAAWSLGSAQGIPGTAYLTIRKNAGATVAWATGSSDIRGTAILILN